MTAPRTSAPRRWFALPLATLALGGAVAAWSQLEERSVQRGLTAVLRSHVDSVGRLVSEALRQSTEALDALAEAREVDLRSRGVPGPADQDEVLVAVLAEAPSLHLVRGELAPADLARVQAALSRGEIVFDLVEAQAGCAVFGAAPERQVACWDDHEFQQLRRRTGLGPLLRELAGSHVVYVAIQDEGGLLASSPGAGPLSGWGSDPALARARAGEAVFRPLPGVVESLGPFLLPDGTTAVVRIGIDAGSVEALVAGTRGRHRLLLAILVAMLLASVVAAFALRRHDLRMEVVGRWVEAQEQQAAHWQRVGLLAAEVAHEVRNPLSTVKMVGQRLGREFAVAPADQAEFAELVDLLGREAGRVETVITDFLDLSRPLRLELRDVDLAPLLDEIAAPLRLRAEAEQKRLVLDVAAGTRVLGDAKRLYQVVVNLAGNALDAVAAGGTVRIVAGASEHGVALAIEDDGPGMSPESLDRVQRPFETSKAHGTGLGLALTRRLVEAHGGTFELESQVGRGTRARCWLPAPGLTPESTGGATS